MSLGYAEKLSYREDLGGQVGNPELFDADDVVAEKVAILAQLVKESSRVIVFTGAGISTSCGIPDFRGPNGVWTRQREGKPLPEASVTFAAAKPSLTHQVLTGLVKKAKITFVVSQNVDGLHLRSGVPRGQLAELHGNCFAERCSKCSTEYIRDFEMATVGFKMTGRSCSRVGCGGSLKDHVLDWEDCLPKDELKASEDHASQADLALCLGTSLQITPACNILLRTVKAGGKMVIVNLQQTPKDKKASLVIRARADAVMSQISKLLSIPIPTYVRQDAVILSCKQNAPVSKPNGSRTARLTLSVSSTHGPKCPLPMVETVDISFPDQPSLKPDSRSRQPYSWQRTVQVPLCLSICYRLRLVAAADPGRRLIELQQTVNILSKEDYQQASMFLLSPIGPVLLTSSKEAFVTQEASYGQEQA